MNYMWENLFRRSDQNQDVFEALRQAFIFQTLSRKELRFVQDTVHVRVFKPGETVFRQGEVGVGMYIILRGQLEIYIDHALDDELPSRSHLVTRLKPGDFLGELSLMEAGSRRTATALASEETQLIGFFRPDLLEILERQPATGVKILMRLCEVFGRRLKETTTKVSELKNELRHLGEKI